MNNIKVTVDLLLKLRFIVHDDGKLVLIQTPKIQFLGFIIDSNSMAIQINGEKSLYILLKIRTFFAKSVSNYLEIGITIWVSYIHFSCSTVRKAALLSFRKTENFLYEAKLSILNKYAIDDLNGG